MEVAFADCAASALFGAHERGQQQARKDRNDRDDDQQFDQSEATAGAKASRGAKPPK